MELVTFSKYQEFKTAMDVEIKGAVQGFVNIGYLLKVARDTNILHESGYASVAEFAKAEYGLTKDVVSRYIRINDRFSENGYSMELKTDYADFGIGKLQEMLALPDEITDVLTPQMTKEQIIEVRREYQKEQEITDVEVMLEQKDNVQQELENNLERVLYQYLKEHPEVFITVDVAVFQAESMQERINGLYKALAPRGVENLMTRISGVGKMMLSIISMEEMPVLLNMRSNEKERYSWNELSEAARYIWMKGNALGTEDVRQRYELIYGCAYELPEIQKVAPVQPENEVASTQNETLLQENETVSVKTEQKEEPVQQLQAEDMEQEENTNETANKEKSVKSEVALVADKDEGIPASDETEIQSNLESDRTDCKEQMQNRARQQQGLEKRKEDTKRNILIMLEEIKEDVRLETWNTFKMHLADLKADAERIEKIDAEIRDLNDMTQTRVEDFLDGEEKEEQADL